jgi:hypothetical protein
MILCSTNTLKIKNSFSINLNVDFNYQSHTQNKINKFILLISS